MLQKPAESPAEILLKANLNSAESPVEIEHFVSSHATCRMPRKRHSTRQQKSKRGESASQPNRLNARLRCAVATDKLLGSCDEVRKKEILPRILNGSEQTGSEAVC